MYQSDASKQNRDRRHSLQKIEGNLKSLEKIEFVDNRSSQLQQAQLKKVIQKVSIPDSRDDESVQHREFTYLVGTLIMDMFVDEVPIISNTGEWFITHPEQLFIHTPASKETVPDNILGSDLKLFPNPEVPFSGSNSDAHYDPNGPDIKQPSFCQGWNHGNGVHLVSDKNFLKKFTMMTLIHETQHLADKNSGREYVDVYNNANTAPISPHSSLSSRDLEDIFRSFKTELNAFYYSKMTVDLDEFMQYLHERQYYRITILYKAGDGVPFRGRTFHAVVDDYINTFRITHFELIDSKGRKMKGGCPISGFNPLNSIRLEALYKILDEIQKSGAMDLLKYMKLRNAVRALDVNDRSFISKRGSNMNSKIETCRTLLYNLDEQRQFNALL